MGLTAEKPQEADKRLMEEYSEFDTIQENPISAKKLGGALSQYRKYHIDDSRIVYRFDSESNTEYVVKIEHRQGVYK